MLLSTWLQQLDEDYFCQLLQKHMQNTLTSHSANIAAANPVNTIEFDEYALIQILDKQACWQGLEEVPASLALFAKHFLTRRSLYQSQGYWQAKGYRLEFGLMRITLVDAGPQRTPGTQMVGLGAQAIADFYGDMEVLHSATQDSVNQLLASFWQRYEAFMAADSAYTVLKVAPDASWPEIQKAYRKLAAQHHPDKGGDTQCFYVIRAAYEQLKTLH